MATAPSHNRQMERRKTMKQRLLAILKEAARAAVSAFLAALGLAASATTSGCCTIITPADEAPSVSLTGAIPVGLQFNQTK